jgi:hypothetical protein
MPSATTTVRGAVSPPEQEFWQRYSPHHEFPLSSVTSVAIHVLALVLLICLGKLLLGMIGETQKPLGETPVFVVPGGGGSRTEADGLDRGAPPRQVEDVGEPNKTDSNANTPKPDRPRLNPDALPIVPLPNQKQGDPLLQEAERERIRTSIIHKAVRDQLRNNLRRGKTNPGKDGGTDKDKDIGRDGPGGTGVGDPRVTRMDRWVMVFDTFSGEDYARQLYGLGAILAIPRGNDEYAIIRDLSQRPAKPELGDIASIQRVYWEDTKRESIAPLSAALGISPVPNHIVAFFPESLEIKLLKIELQFKGLREEQIKETRFKIRKKDGGYEPIVVDQTAK